jgi:putative membrane protein
VQIVADEKPNADVNTELAVERTIMAAGRTLMAWVRTALSLISFGFTIYKFLMTAAETEASFVKHPSAVLLRVEGVRRFGLLLIGLGTVAVLAGSIEYFQTLHRLNALSHVKYKPLNVTFLVGMVVGFLGLVLFFTIITHTEIF